MSLTASEVGSLTRTIEKWELAEYICAGLVTLACFGEYVADFTKWWMRGGLWKFLGLMEKRKDALGKLSTLVLISALALELICLVKTNQLSGLVVGSLSERSEEAFNKASNALEDANRATAAASTALTVGREARQEAGSFKADIETAKKQSAEAESHLAEAVAMAKSEETELRKLESQVEPRTLIVEQQRSITATLRRFSGRKVTVATYGLDGEGAAVGTQIIASLRAAGLAVNDARAQTIVTGGFEFGVHVRGPATEQDLVAAIGNALSSIGKLQVWLNAGAIRAGAVQGGAATRGGATTMGGGGGPPGPSGPTAPGTPVFVMVGIKPVAIALAQ
jgi:hypothetical protein